MAKFPRAGSGHDPKAEDPMMKRVKMERGEIGSRPSGMPSGMTNMPSINHVGDSTKSGS